MDLPVRHSAVSDPTHVQLARLTPQQYEDCRRYAKNFYLGRDKAALRLFSIMEEAEGLAIDQHDYRGCANMAMEGLLKTKDPHQINRYWCLEVCYLKLFRQQKISLTKKDKKFLHGLLENEKEPNIIRSKVAFTLGILKALVKHDADAGADYFRQSLHLVESATEQEKKRIIISCYLLHGISMPKRYRVSEVLEVDKVIVVQNLSTMERSTTEAQEVPAKMDQMAERLWLEDINLEGHVINSYFEDQALTDRLKAGGSACDRCGKTAEELGVVNLRCCSRCNRAYYCSADCQRAAWKSGHKQACRKKKQIEIGDFMELNGLVNKPELNKRIVRIEKAVEADKFQVKTTADNRTFVVSKDKLFHLRPAK